MRVKCNADVSYERVSMVYRYAKSRLAVRLYAVLRKRMIRIKTDRNLLIRKLPQLMRPVGLMMGTLFLQRDRRIG